MAIGNSRSQDSSFVMYVDDNHSSQRFGKRSRVNIVAGALLVAMCAAVALVSVNRARHYEMISKVTGHENALAVGLVLSAVNGASISQLEQQISQYRNSEISSLDASEKPSQMLALVSPSIQTALADSGKLCAKKDIIFAKFDQLLAKLKAQAVTLNATDAAAYESKQAALKVWLETEADYRLMEEKVQEATEGSTFARAQYEKWAATVKDTKERIDTMETQYSTENADIQAEKELILEIMRLLGVLDDQPLSTNSAAAGGFSASATTAATQASPLQLKEVEAKMRELKKRAAALGKGEVEKVQQLSIKLASFSETDEVKRILTDMLKDLEIRGNAITTALESAKKALVEHQKELVKYETELVDLSNAVDKAKQEADAQDLSRSKLSGDKTTAAETYTDEHASYTITSPPTEREIFIINMIKLKITEFCSAGSATATSTTTTTSSTTTAP